MEQLEYVFCSHAHEDHVGGLAAALAYFPAYHVYSPVADASTKCFQDFVKYTQQQGLQVEVPAVVEHELSVAFHQHTQRLTHIDEMHLQGCVHRIHSRRSRSGRVRHYIGASARDGRQPAAARKAQHQCGGSGQRSKALPQAFLRRVYFFFFPVFHVVFSFC